MNLVLHQFSFRPYCIPILAALEAFGASFRDSEVPIHWRDESISLTRRCYFQVLVWAHGQSVVFESTAGTLDVTRHVDREFAGGRLFPARQNGLQRELILHLETEVESVAFKLVDRQRIADITDVLERTESVRFKERRFGGGYHDAGARCSEITDGDDGATGSGRPHVA